MTDKSLPIKKKVLALGLDGVPRTLLDDFLAEDILPNFKKILSSGYALHQMDASIPEVSSTSWTSFYTGVNPEEHGIYGFMELRPGTYDLAFPNMTNVTAPSLWNIVANNTGAMSSTLSRKYEGKFSTPLRSIVMNIPQTYPAVPINGVLSAGFVCPDLKKGTYPGSAYDYLVSMGYMGDVDSAKASEDADAFFREIFTSLEKRLEAYLHFMEDGDWDIFIGVVTETDRLHHFFFDAARNPSHQYNATFRKIYKAIDEVIGALYGRFMEMTGGEGFFLTMSDHGFTEIKSEVYLNRWLEKEGFLNLDEGRQYFDKIDSGTRAFALDPSRLYLNRQGRYPRGAVAPAEEAALLGDLKIALAGLKDEGGNPVIKAVYGRDELYTGPSSEKGPDLVCLSHDGFDLKGSLRTDAVFGRSHFTGMHTRHDAHSILPEGVFSEGRLHIESLAGIILNNITA
ncbi:MAG: alkaline phosphatase family protein [Thermodesulfobacteriota bacterium]|nr:MAG: alkaline phosphatase family protein [Thermodesulfobacteriota bacterium]